MFSSRALSPVGVAASRQPSMASVLWSSHVRNFLLSGAAFAKAPSSAASTLATNCRWLSPPTNVGSVSSGCMAASEICFASAGTFFASDAVMAVLKAVKSPDWIAASSSCAFSSAARALVASSSAAAPRTSHRLRCWVSVFMVNGLGWKKAVAQFFSRKSAPRVNDSFIAGGASFSDTAPRDVLADYLEALDSHTMSLPNFVTANSFEPLPARMVTPAASPICSHFTSVLVGLPS